MILLYNIFPPRGKQVRGIGKMGGANCSTILDESLSEVEVFGTTAQITQLGVKWDGQDL